MTQNQYFFQIELNVIDIFKNGNQLTKMQFNLWNWMISL